MKGMTKEMYQTIFIGIAMLLDLSVITCLLVWMLLLPDGYHCIVGIHNPKVLLLNVGCYVR